jgi:hypothetical protein
MANNGPLIPGIREFDRPRKGWPAWVWWLIAAAVVLVVLVLAAGFVGGVGPLRSLGQTTASLSPVQYRPTATDNVIQVAVAMPASGLCRDDDVSVTAFERSNRIEVESSVTRSRRSSCPVTIIGGDLRWVDVVLAEPLGTRTVIRLSDRAALPRESASS